MIEQRGRSCPELSGGGGRADQTRENSEEVAGPELAIQLLNSRMETSALMSSSAVGSS